MHKATFLSYRPSQVAATAILVAIDLNKAEGSAEMEQYEQMCQAQVITSPRRRPDNSNFSSTCGAAVASQQHSRKFNSLLQGCDESDLRDNQAAISPPSNSCFADSSPNSKGQTGGENQTLNKAWSRQCSIFSFKNLLRSSFVQGRHRITRKSLKRVTFCRC